MEPEYQVQELIWLRCQGCDEDDFKAGDVAWEVHMTSPLWSRGKELGICCNACVLDEEKDVPVDKIYWERKHPWCWMQYTKCIITKNRKDLD